MDIISEITGHEPQIATLFTDSFTASDGADEGRLIGDLSRTLLQTTPARDLYTFAAYEDQTLVGCILLTRTTHAQTDRLVFLLSPVAVRTGRQRSGIGQRLITFGLDALRKDGVDVVLTYGDPAYYGKTGFRQITETTVPAPMPLSQPHGWLGQSLSGGEITPLQGPTHCVPAFQNPALW